MTLTQIYSSTERQTFIETDTWVNYYETRDFNGVPKSSFIFSLKGFRLDVLNHAGQVCFCCYIPHYTLLAKKKKANKG